MLAHFKPFSITNRLVEDHNTFLSTFESYNFSKFHLQIMNNWEEIHLCEDTRDAERLKRQDSSLQEQIFSSAIFDEAQDQEMETTHVMLSDTLQSFQSQQDMLSIDESGFFSSEKIHTEDEKDIFIETDKHKIDKWTRQLKDIEKMALGAKRNSLNMAQQAQSVHHIPDTLTGEKLMNKLRKRTKS